MQQLFALAGAGDAGIWCALPMPISVRSPSRSRSRRWRRRCGGFTSPAKALELTAMALDRIVGQPPLRPARLPARTREQVHAVRDMLVAAMQEPPSLAELARATGLNPPS